ncbi:YciI family protein [Microbacterium sediminis]|uniref:Uncharacterized protein n=1 Tax=Microbacterium sediminis TaxID=904291 RepID=A0A1B9N9K4_9MICO|nr:YciI family protein [Microbacterium sediminis]OCG73282.1 hypothetical protein A7J15_08265 [Microbacterium sediminis]QBR75174.1 hypothetical protein E3O41_12725 [Microbacterium sediminis]
MSEQWLILEHTATEGNVGQVFSHPDFPKHVAFLRALEADGLLVAAGPLPDTLGNGMAIIRAADADAAAEVTRRAQEEDGSVQAGLLTVRVRPWNVRFGSASG